MVAQTPNTAPSFSVKIQDVGEMNQGESKGVQSVYVEDHVHMIGVCEITFAAGETKWSGFTLGKSVEVHLGGNTNANFLGTITGMRHRFSQGKQMLTVLASDPLYKLAASRNTKVHEPDLSDSTIAGTVITDAGCTKGTVDDSESKRPYVFQRNESDLNFLRRLAARNGYLLKANHEGKIDFAKPQYGGPVKTIEITDIISLEYTISGRGVPQGVTVYGWDYQTKAMVQGSASAQIDQIGSGTPAVGDSPIWEDQTFISDIWVASQTDAKAIAEAELNRAARNFIRGRATIRGTGECTANMMVEFTGHPEGYNPTGYVLSTRHRLGVGVGYSTELVFSSNTKPDTSG